MREWPHPALRCALSDHDIFLINISHLVQLDFMKKPTAESPRRSTAIKLRRVCRPGEGRDPFRM